MAHISQPTTEDLTSYSPEEIKIYIFSLQDALQSKLNSGLSMDDILDSEDPFESLEPLLPQEVYPILCGAGRTETRNPAIPEQR